MYISNNFSPLLPRRFPVRRRRRVYSDNRNIRVISCSDACRIASTRLLARCVCGVMFNYDGCVFARFFVKKLPIETTINGKQLCNKRGSTSWQYICSCLPAVWRCMMLYIVCHWLITLLIVVLSTGNRRRFVILVLCTSALSAKDVYSSVCNFVPLRSGEILNARSGIRNTVLPLVFIAREKRDTLGYCS